MHSIAFNRIQHILIATTINIGDKRQTHKSSASVDAWREHSNNIQSTFTKPLKAEKSTARKKQKKTTTNEQTLYIHTDR